MRRATLSLALLLAGVAASAGAQSTPARSGSAAQRAQPAERRDTSTSTSVAERGAKGEVSFTREVFNYEAEGRRDPFLSLLSSSDLRPLINDLRVATILYDPTGRNSVAVLRDQSSKDQYRVKVGQTLGRMRVTAILPKSVTFTINEFGFSRQETLVVGDTTNARKQ